MFDEDRGSREPQKQKIGFWYVLRTLLICAVITVIISVQIYRFRDALNYWLGNREVKQRCVQEVNVLMQQQESMKNELNKLKYNKLTQERLAREMGYVKPGEVVYKFANVNQDNNIER
jgi:cell division protein FtsB